VTRRVREAARRNPLWKTDSGQANRDRCEILRAATFPAFDEYGTTGSTSLRSALVTGEAVEGVLGALSHCRARGQLGESVSEHCYAVLQGPPLPVDIINHCVWLYFRFPLSFREVEELMLERGVAVS
jgi:hypothetical protein